MGGVRPDLVVIAPPALEQASGVSEVVEDLLVQQLVPQPADEALDEGVLLGLARRDVVPVEAGAVGPRQDGARGELRAIVADDRRRRSRVVCRAVCSLRKVRHDGARTFQHRGELRVRQPFHLFDQLVEVERLEATRAQQLGLLERQT
jgi:hypothetical protein